MLDNLAILCLAGATVMALLVILEFIAKYFDWK